MSHINIRKSFILPLFAALIMACHSQKEAIYLLSSDYTGPVVILFGQPDGIPLTTQDDFYIYNIPKDGILRVSNPPILSGGNELFFYDEPPGERIQLEYLYPKGRGKAWEENPKTFDQVEPNDPRVFVMGRVAGTFNTGTGPVHYRAFKVGKASDSEKLYLETQDRIAAIQKQLASGNR